MRNPRRCTLLLLLALSVFAGCGDEAPPEEPRRLDEPRSTPGTIDGASIRVSVRTSAGRSLAGARVRVREADGARDRGQGASATTGEGGHAVVDGLKPGRYVVTLETAGPYGAANPDRADGLGYRVFERIVDARAGVIADVAFEPPGAGTLEVQVDRSSLRATDVVRIDLVRRQNETDWSVPARQPRVLGPFQSEGAVPGKERWVFPGLEPGEYRAVLWTASRVPAVATVRVGEGTVNQVEMAPGARGTSLRLAWLGEPATQAISFNLNQIGGASKNHGLLSGDGTPIGVEGLPEGEYVLILWDALVALRVSVPRDTSNERVAVRPPRLSEGSARLTVAVGRKGRPARKLAVLVAPSSTSGTAAPPSTSSTEVWARLGETWPVAVFERLPPGTYDVTVLDGVFGQTVGIPGASTHRTVAVGTEPVTLTVELDGP